MKSVSFEKKSYQFKLSKDQISEFVPEVDFRGRISSRSGWIVNFEERVSSGVIDSLYFLIEEGE